MNPPQGHFTEPPLRLVADGPDVLVDVWVVPGSSRTAVAGLHDGSLKVWVAAPPEAGRANAALCRLLQDVTGARSATVIAGATGRRKRVRLAGLSVSEAHQLLEGKGR